MNFQKLLEEKSERIPETGCQVWMGAILQNGYGVIAPERKQVYVHRVSYEVYVGPISAGARVLHNCDVKTCINPKHLRLGTPADNAKDRELRGQMRHVTGEENGRSVLTLAQVLVIKERLQGTESYNHIARDYGVKPRTIQDIHTGRTWVNASVVLPG